MVRTWLSLLFAASLLAAAPPRPAARPDAVAAFRTAAGEEARILRYRGFAFPWVERAGVPVLLDPAAVAAGAWVPCRTAQGPARIARTTLVRHLRERAWPKGGAQAFLGRLEEADRRWELWVAGADDGSLEPRGLPLANLPPDLRAGAALVLGRLQDLESIYQRNEAFLVMEGWAPLD